MTQYTKRRRFPWLEKLGFSAQHRESMVRCRKVGLSGCVLLLCLTLTAASYLASDNAQTYDKSLTKVHSGASRRLLATNDSDSHGHLPEWEQCDYEQAHVPGAWLFNHAICILIIFIALAIICDDFFVPSLEVISEKLNLSEDVAGATFMAAGSSAPELFTSVAGVAVQTDVGVGTIVGSAVFNLLIIIALTGALAGQVLHLDWRPLIRDSFFYAMSIGCFVGFSWDGYFQHYEACILLTLYITYIILMFFNPKIIEWMGTWRCCGRGPAVAPSEHGSEKESSPDPSGEAGLNQSNPKLQDERRPSLTGGHARRISLLSQRSHSDLEQPGARYFHHKRGSIAGVLICPAGSLKVHRDSGFHSTETSGFLPSVETSHSDINDGLNGGDHSYHHHHGHTLHPPDRRSSKPNGPPHEEIEMTTRERRTSNDEDDDTTDNRGRVHKTSSFDKPGMDSSGRANSYHHGTGLPSLNLKSAPHDQTAISEEDSEVSNGGVNGGVKDGINGDIKAGTEKEADVEAEKEQEDDENEEEETIQVCPCLPCCCPVRTQAPSSEEARTKGGCLNWCKLILRWILFIPAFPFVCLFSWTIPDCSKEHNKKYFIMSFLMSVLWIAILSFAMVTLVGRTGCIIGIDSYVMGLVVIAIGTSIPDALSSILVARDGYGDMAVSNAIGSNVFDINLGLGLPFIIRIAIDKGIPIELLDDAEWADMHNGSMPILPHAKFGFILLLILIIALAIFAISKFNLSKWIGISFVVIYVLFLTYAFTQELYCVRQLGIYC